MKHNLKDLVRYVRPDIILFKKILNKNESLIRFIAGHNGLVGNAVLNLLKKGFKNLLTVERKN